MLQRRPSRWTGIVNFLVLAGLIIPPAVVPTIWVLQGLHLFKTLHGLILIEVAYGLSFSVLLFRAFIATIPRELDEAAIIDGAGPMRLFFQIILPLLRPVIVTVIVVQSVAIFNDFTNPLYYLPGNDNVTVQLTLYNFLSQFNTSYNLLFMNILLITIPPLIVFLFFNRQIVAGLTAGAVKGGVTSIFVEGEFRRIVVVLMQVVVDTAGFGARRRDQPQKEFPGVLDLVRPRYEMRDDSKLLAHVRLPRLLQSSRARSALATRSSGRRRRFQRRR